ncbi:MAG: succinylglutamate desuccinylase/aspartoacylase family protein [Xanthomonadales bacterium]|nr:succinylglutamate desuccinylase/aspartoacylase family protein [Xanthomonadales bacterium]
MAKPISVVIGGQSVAPGESRTIDVELPGLYTQAETHMPVQVIRGLKKGPRMFVSGVIHGDELNGMEIIRRVLNHNSLKRIKGTLVAVPIVNVYGCINRSRYLPDGRDLNRVFPGSPRGSMASRLAHLFMQEIVLNSDYGIDLHTAGGHRDNLPQVRMSPDIPATQDMAQAFGAPVILNADLRDRSLRHAALKAGIPMLLYEGGAALSYDEVAIRAGVRGVISVMREIGMLPRVRKKKSILPLVSSRSGWTRAPDSGVFRNHSRLGEIVKKGQVLGRISHPIGHDEVEIKAKRSGVLIGCTRLPLVHEGEALFHIATLKELDGATDTIDQFHEAHSPEQEGDLRRKGEPPVF